MVKSGDQNLLIKYYSSHFCVRKERKLLNFLKATKEGIILLITVGKNMEANYFLNYTWKKIIVTRKSLLDEWDPEVAGGNH